MARRFHLFPFRTEKLSFATPMVLRTSGRVGSRRFTESLEIAISRGFFCARRGTGNGRAWYCKGGLKRVRADAAYKLAAFVGQA